MTERPSVRALRYALPNLITLSALVFGLLSLVATIEGRYVDAGWWIGYAVMTDRVDGLVARMLRSTSELGVQLDSFADFINFGVAPPVLVFAALSHAPELSYGEGVPRTLLFAACVLYVFGATFRLARFNIASGPAYQKIFFGVPTTMAGGIIVMWFLALIKYSAAGAPLATAAFGGPKIFGDALVVGAGVWKWFPVVMVAGGYAMASSLRMPKLGLARSKAATAFILVNVLAGYICGIAWILPEYILIAPTLWLIIFLAWGQMSANARAMTPPPLFPLTDPEPGKEPMRPEDDMVPDSVGGLDD